jgi:dihydroxyacetone kinase-like predicted kinase
VKQLSNKEVFVIPSRTIPQGIAAIMNYSDSLNLKENLDFMSEAIGRIRTGEVTTATRDAKIKDISIKKGEIIAIADDELCAHGNDAVKVSLSLIDKLNEGGGEVLTIYWGEGSNKDDLDRIVDEVKINYPTQDVEVYEGGQPLYPYIFSLE